VLEQGEKMKINDTENAVFDDKGTLHIDGASYLPDSDYEWFFAIDRSELPKLYAELSNDEVNVDELPDRFIKTLMDRNIDVGRLKDICELKDIDHHFSCWW
jgi:hypothetical protein